MPSNDTIDVRALLDSRPVGRWQKWMILLCFLVVVMDGFDVVIMGFVGPALKEAWGWTNDDLAPVLSAALVGLTLGALTAGPLGDRFGRRRVLCSSVMLFGLFTLLVACADSRWQFIVCRFIAGFAMGGIMPMVATFAREVSPAGLAQLAAGDHRVFRVYGGGSGRRVPVGVAGAPPRLGERVRAGGRRAPAAECGHGVLSAGIADLSGAPGRQPRADTPHRRALRARLHG